MWYVRPVLVMLAMSFGSLAQADDGFEAAFKEHVSAVQARDLARLERTITKGESLVLILPNGVQTTTRQAYLDFHREFFASTTWTIEFEAVSKIAGNDFVIQTTRSYYRDLENGKPIRSSSWVTFTFKKEAGAWRLVHDQNTRLPPSP